MKTTARPAIRIFAPAFAPALALSLALAGGAAAGAPFFPPYGLDRAAMDPKVKPGDDFFDYVNGAWLAATPIPADKSSVTMGQMERDRTNAQLHEMLEALARTAPQAPTTTEGKAGAFYAAFMDEARVESLGGAPIAADLEAIRAAATRRDIARLMGRSVRDFDGGFFAASIDADLKDPTRYSVYLNQAGLGLPDRDYYLQESFAPQRAKYQAYIAQLLALAGWRDADAAAAKVLALETEIAKASWSKEEQRDVVASYNPMTPAELAAYAPGFDWAAYLEGAGLQAKTRLVVGEKSAFPRIAAIFAAADPQVLRAWLAFNVVDAAAPYLSKPYQDAYFAFRLHTLAGQPEPEVRWKRAVTAVSGSDCIYSARACFGTLDWAVGQAYVTRYFPPSTKAKIEALVADLKAAFRARIEKLDWMGPATRAEALKKLDTYVVKVGYPDKWRDYSGVVIRRDDLVGDVHRAADADWSFYLARSDGPVDRADWAMTPQTVDAYNGNLRDIVFPAAILQAPEFDPDADPAVNYGAIGAVIGHEMTHGFDDQGRTIDAAGALRDWWTPADAAAFKARTTVLGRQYATYEPVAGLHIKPDLTMGENLADLGGLAIALDAYHASLKGAPAPVIDGLTGDQRFFLAFAQSWRGKAREDAIRQQTVSDPHSFRKFRVNGVVRNIDGWYAAFGVKPGDALYLAPTDRARVW